MLERIQKQEMVKAPNGQLVPSGLIKVEYNEVLQTGIPKVDGDKQQALEAITVTISTGKVFYADPISRADISDAIAIALETSQASTTWKLAQPINGSKLAIVTLAELQEARLLGLQMKGSIIGV